MTAGQRGFTMIELLTVMVIVGILAAVAIPRLDTGGFRSLEFHDQTVAALRFAQKTATSHRRLVCVSFPDTGTVQLNIEMTPGSGSCTLDLPIPGSANAPNNQVRSGDSLNAGFTSLPAAFNFDSQGATTGATLTIAGAAPITVVGATGYVE